MIEKPRVSFEIEGYVVQEGKFYFPSISENKLFALASGDCDAFHPIYGHMIEGKTNPLQDSVEAAARSALDNLQAGLAKLQEISGHDNLGVVCDSLLYDELPDERKEEIGTHVHIDYEPLKSYLGGHETDFIKIVWRMRQSASSFLEKYCYSSRFRRRVEKAKELDFSFIPLRTDSRQTINYRSWGTIEIALADSTDDLGTLIRLGEDAQECAVEAAEFVAQHPQFTVPPHSERGEIMREMLADFL